uniref:Uncharacterized protein n=1 Tax=Gibberella zeae TaxID=5518 RepID=A0A4E9EMN4_GIBZA
MVIVWGGIGVSYREIVGWSLVKRLSHRHSLCLFAQNTQGKHAAMRAILHFLIFPMLMTNVARPRGINPESEMHFAQMLIRPQYIFLEVSVIWGGRNVDPKDRTDRTSKEAMRRQPTLRILEAFTAPGTLAECHSGWYCVLTLRQLSSLASVEFRVGARTVTSNIYLPEDTIESTVEAISSSPQPQANTRCRVGWCDVIETWDYGDLDEMMWI